MPRRTIEAQPVKKPKRGHLFDKLSIPKAPSRYKSNVETVKVTNRKLPPKPHRATKAEGNWTPRKVGAKKGSKRFQPKTYSDELIIEALRLNGGLITYACRAIGMDMTSMSLRIKNTPILEAARTEAREHYKDKAERVIGYHLDRKSLPAAIHVTRYVCRDRGYVEKQEQEQVNGPINLDAMTDDQLNGLVEAIAKKLEGR